MVTMQNWMFLSSFQQMRERMLEEKTIRTLTQIGFNSFPSLNSKIALATVFSVLNRPIAKYVGNFVDLNSAPQAADKSAVFRMRNSTNCFQVSVDDFKKIPGSPVAYWASLQVRDIFVRAEPLEKHAPVRQGMATGDNDRFLRNWAEVDVSRSRFRCKDKEEAFASTAKWFPYNKGGGYRKWNGNKEFLVRFDEPTYAVLKTVGNHCPSEKFYFRPAVTWSFIGILFGVRQAESGFVFDVAGSSCFPPANSMQRLTGFLGSKLPAAFLGATNQTLNFQAGNIRSLPVLKSVEKLNVDLIVEELVALARSDWDAYERSWDFQSLPILATSSEPTPILELSYTAWIAQNRITIAEMKRLEEDNNRIFIDAYGLADELTPDVPIKQITLTVNPAYRYGGKLTEEELWTRFRQNTLEELVSYAVGCMMGRYSLDEPGLIYAHSGNEGFDASRYASFPADDDGIVPLTDKEWFADDAANRLVEFIAQAWDKAHLEANLRFLADNLSPKKGEGSRDTLRRYLCDSFFKDHLQTYKKRPIYWLFSSGKQKAFQCLVYLHRYNASTLARMRTLHVIPLSAKLNSYANKLEQDIDASTSTAEKKALEKQLTTLHNQQAELATFDEKLRHHADQRITLDLDDGVKVNYGKFGDLLAEVKAVTGGASD
jgi:hypothetical protein